MRDLCMNKKLMKAQNTSTRSKTSRISSSRSCGRLLGSYFWRRLYFKHTLGAAVVDHRQSLQVLSLAEIRRTIYKKSVSLHKVKKPSSTRPGKHSLS